MFSFTTSWVKALVDSEQTPAAVEEQGDTDSTDSFQLLSEPDKEQSPTGEKELDPKDESIVQDESSVESLAKTSSSDVLAVDDSPKAGSEDTPAAVEEREGLSDAESTESFLLVSEPEMEQSPIAESDSGEKELGLEEKPIVHHEDTSAESLSKTSSQGSSAVDETAKAGLESSPEVLAVVAAAESSKKKSLDDSFIIIEKKLTHEIKVKRRTYIYDVVLEELIRERNLPSDWSPSSRDCAMVFKRLVNKLDKTPLYIKNMESWNCEFKDPRKRELLRLAPYLCFKQPPNLVEKADGYTHLKIYKDESLEITELTFDVLEKLKLIQQRFIVFGIPYQEWTKLCVTLYLAGDLFISAVITDPGFYYNMPWGDFLMVLTGAVSIERETAIRKQNVDAKFRGKNELAGPFIQEKLMKIKALPPLIDKNHALLLLKRFIKRHVYPFYNRDFKHSMANLEEIEYLLRFMDIRLDVNY